MIRARDCLAYIGQCGAQGGGNLEIVIHPAAGVLQHQNYSFAPSRRDLGPRHRLDKKAGEAVCLADEHFLA